MKMVFAIISKADEDITVTALNEAGFFATRLSTIGGFLKKTNTSVIVGTEDEKVVGTEDEKVPQVLDILKKYAGKRIDEMPYVAPSMARASNGVGTPYVTVPTNAGGATVFVLDVDQFEKF